MFLIHAYLKLKKVVSYNDSIGSSSFPIFVSNQLLSLLFCKTDFVSYDFSIFCT